MSNIFRYLFLLVMPVLIASCASFSEIHFDVLKPAVYSVPPDIKSVVLVNNSIDFPDTAVNIIKVDEEIVNIDTSKVRDYPAVVLKIAGEALNSRMFFDTVYVDTLKYKELSKGKILEELKPYQIDSLCRKYGVDAIVSLDAYKYTNNVSIVTLDFEEFFSTFDASAINYWRIYKCADHSVMKMHLQKDTIFWDSSGTSLNTSVRHLPDFGKATDEIGSYLAYKFVDYLAPHWEDVSRRLYTNGNMNFQNAAEWISRNNWQEAEKIWNFIYKNGSAKAKVRAALNLAVSFERDGDIDNAVKWGYNAYKSLLNRSNASALNLYVMKYYNELTVRKREKRKLVEQLGDI